MKQKIWTQTYDINTLLVNPQKKLSLFGMLNLLQDTAWLHATHLGHGYEDMIREQTAWVLTRQKLQMKSWPSWREQVSLRTWVRSVNGIMAVRDFEILLNEKVIGQATTDWLILDLQTRKPSQKAAQLTDGETREDAPEFISASKIPLRHDLNKIAAVKVRNSDLDLNGHVNNTRYAQWIMDSAGELATPMEYEVNFLAETKAGEEITIFTGETADGKIQFQGFREADQKVVFAALATLAR